MEWNIGWVYHIFADSHQYEDQPEVSQYAEYGRDGENSQSFIFVQ